MFLENKVVINCVNVQDKITDEEGWISLGPWGGEKGKYWAYKPEGPILQITIRYRDFIDSISFESKSCDDLVIGRFDIGCINKHSGSASNTQTEEGLISLGPWGGKDGVYWAYKANEPIMQISICYGEAINSILFQSKSYDGLVIGRSKKFGGTGGHPKKTHNFVLALVQFCIDSSVEQLSSINVTFGDYNGQVAIISLCFYTNLKKIYGPFGTILGASSVSIPIEDGVIVGFHGRGGTYLTAIGIFVAPKVNNLPSSEKKFNSLHSIQDPDYAPTQLEVNFYLFFFYHIQLVNQNSHAHFFSHKIVT
ncbi:hypothetical protein RHGRI_033514 [Rhododendron griersonianum]|uniref:Jacalin-type lectin domain-containing protein n=1 Tax=Rhododendron griersonianum TaxID=479676 RepID=A0AAV6HX18_9ERIC|nr:hypothetical protein RHGRI_033514 [Rhododendron griersonianum]